MADINVKKVKTTDLELKDRLVAVQRVTKVTKGGRHFSFAAIVVVGDEKGVVGYGLGKANEVTTAISKGIEDAKKNLVKIPLIKSTIPHEQSAKFGGATGNFNAHKVAYPQNDWRVFGENFVEETLGEYNFYSIQICHYILMDLDFVQMY